jgi:NAD(P) transhydrogenase subunit alpha
LQAIATAKRLGAKVEAFDTRKETEEQVKSLGAKFVKIDLGETEQTKDGYAKSLTSEQLAKQRQEMAKVCARSDIIITTAQVFGKKAPVLITYDMLKQMQPGTVIIDMAVSNGGNVEGSIAGKEVIINQVKIIGHDNLAGTIALHASQMYSNNVYNLVEYFWNKEQAIFSVESEDEIMKGCLLTLHGQIIHPQLKVTTCPVIQAKEGVNKNRSYFVHITKEL